MGFRMNSKLGLVLRVVTCLDVPATAGQRWLCVLVQPGRAVLSPAMVHVHTQHIGCTC